MKKIFKNLTILFYILIFNASLISCNLHKGELQNGKYSTTKIIEFVIPYGLLPSKIDVIINDNELILKQMNDEDLCNSTFILVEENIIKNGDFFDTHLSGYGYSEDELNILINEFKKINKYYISKPIDFVFADYIYLFKLKNIFYMAFVTNNADKPEPTSVRTIFKLKRKLGK